MIKFVLTARAEADLFAIRDYIAQDSREAANKVIGKFEECFDRLAKMPGMGHFRTDLLPKRYKFWSIYSYLVVYRWKSAPIQIVAVIHGARDLEAFFDEFID